MKSNPYNCKKMIKFLNGMKLILSETEEIIFSANYINVEDEKGEIHIYPSKHVFSISYLRGDK